MNTFLLDVKTMVWRSALKTLRTPEALVMSIFVPICVMLLFINVFGGAMDVGDYNFANFIVPGVLVNCLFQSASTTAISINGDMTKGIVKRFRSMAISKSAFLIGSVIVASIKSLVTTLLLLGVAMLAGFRPAASPAQWLAVAGIILLFILSSTWLATFFGVFFKDSESAGGILALVAMLSFLSSGMSPTHSMPRFLRYFAENQPMTPFINSTRALMNGYEITGNNLWLTLIYWGGILLISLVATVSVYQKRSNVL